MKALILKYNFLEYSDHYVYLLLTPHIGSLESLQHSALIVWSPKYIETQNQYIVIHATKITGLEYFYFPGVSNPAFHPKHYIIRHIRL